MEHAISGTSSQGLCYFPMHMGCADPRAGARSDISLLVPADRTAMEASGRDGGGDPNCVTVRAPCIGLIPASANLAAAAEGPRGLVITLDSRLLETKSRQVFGTTTSQPRLWLQAWDPFLRETASTLTSALARRLDLGCLEAFADVIALHISCRYYHG